MMERNIGDQSIEPQVGAKAADGLVVGSISGYGIMVSQKADCNLCVIIVIVLATIWANAHTRKGNNMPMILKPGQLYQIKARLENPPSKGSPYLRVSNRCFSLEGATKRTFNRTDDLVPKPMRADDVAAVRSRTGFSPFIETGFVRRGA